ncbi:MAG: CoB--CoM heterodisulfide reductase iron-sulfur subunit B family protein [Dissulfuribacterales bacterium]
MKYFYYPGCSLEGSAIEYNISTRSLMDALDIELVEIDGWNCCGATAAEAQNHLLSLVLPARNLALAEALAEAIENILVPCSACYLNLKKVTEKTRNNPALVQKINQVLAIENLRFNGQKHVRHLLDVLVSDLDPKIVEDRVKKRMDHLIIAPYYGCQCLRPYAVFDDPEAPTSMEPIIRATGAHIHSWNMGNKCCGASLMNTHPDVAIDLVTAILTRAQGADAIVTVCPMCQMNLEAYQARISKKIKQDVSIPVLYLPQFLGLAFDLPTKDVRLDLNLSDTRHLLGLAQK